MGGPVHLSWLLQLVLVCLKLSLETSSLLNVPKISSLSRQCDRPCFNGGTCEENQCICAPGRDFFYIFSRRHL